MTSRIMTPALPRPPVREGSRHLLAFDSAAVSHDGAVRDHNEDYAFAGEVLLAVADGVARSADGGRASEIAIAAVAPLELRFDLAPEDEVNEAVCAANERVEEAAAADSALRGMATTLTVLRLDGETVVVGHVGDSRAYRLRAGQLDRLTRDDSFVQQLVDDALITPEQAAHHPWRSVVVQAIGSGVVRPAVHVHAAVVGDRYLVCSDGLSDYVDQPTIERSLVEAPDPDACCAALLAAALAAGAPDNVTCVVGDVRRWRPRPGRPTTD